MPATLLATIPVLKQNQFGDGWDQSECHYNGQDKTFFFVS